MTDRPVESANQRDEKLRAKLRALAVDPPENGFRASLHRRLVAEAPPPAPGWWARVQEWVSNRRLWLWPAGGLAAGVGVYALLVLAFGNPLQTPAPSPSAPKPLAEISSGPVPPSFQVPSSKVAVIKLAFAAEVAVEDVTFEVKLPEGLSFWSGGQRLDDRSFRWLGRLEAGENIIPIAVRGDRPGRYPVLASVEVGGRVLEQRVVMDVSAEGT